MRRLTTLTKLCRNYLFANQEALDKQYVKEIGTRLQLISDAKEQLFEALLKEDSDSESEQTIEDCKAEIKYQLEILNDFAEDFTQYCVENGLEAAKEDILESLDLSSGTESELYQICYDWEIVGTRAHDFFISQMAAVWPDEYLHVLYTMQEKMIAGFMETYRIIDKDLEEE